MFIGIDFVLMDISLSLDVVIILVILWNYLVLVFLFLKFEIIINVFISYNYYDKMKVGNICICGFFSLRFGKL